MNIEKIEEIKERLDNKVHRGSGYNAFDLGLDLQKVLSALLEPSDGCADASRRASQNAPEEEVVFRNTDKRTIMFKDLATFHYITCPSGSEIVIRNSPDKDPLKGIEE